MLEGMDYCVRYVSFPMKVHGMTVLDENGFYNIYININLNEDAQFEALRHELKHLERDDFSKKDTPIELIEAI